MTAEAETGSLATAQQSARILEAALRTTAVPIKALNLELGDAGGLMNHGAPLCPSH